MIIFQKAVEEDNLVRIDRAELEPNPFGYVAGFSEHLLMLSVIDDGLRYNGFEIVRVKDITSYESPVRQQSLVEDALAARGLRRPKAPDIDLTNFGTALATMKSEVTMVTMFLELDEPGSIYIGKLSSVCHEFVHFYFIDEDARMDEETSALRLSEITRICFGSGYEEALQLVQERRKNQQVG